MCSTNQVQEAWNVPPVNSCLVFVVFTFAHLSCPFTAITEGIPRKFQSGTLGPHRTEDDFRPVPVWGKVFAAQFKIARIWLDGHDSGVRKTGEKVCARIPNIGPKIEDQAGGRDVAYAGVFIDYKDLVNDFHVARATQTSDHWIPCLAWFDF